MNESNFPIDIVYLWVDGNDLEWLKNKEYWRKKLGIKHTNETDNARYIENEELRYSLRSIEKNAPWINKIFIVTNGQIPDWLDINHPKIRLVTHSEIMPQEALPTFNSCAIEACVSNIPDLSEHFLLANDDCFINKPIKPSFFFDKNGKPICRFRRAIFDEYILNSNDYRKSIYNSFVLMNRKFSTKFKNIIPHHNIDAYLKSEYVNCTEEFKNEFNNVIFSKFRNTTVQRIIFSLYIIAKKKATLKIINTFSLSNITESQIMEIKPLKEMQETYSQTNPILLCVNDESTADYMDRQNLKIFFEFIYPNQSKWEKSNENRRMIKKEIVLNKKRTKYFLQKIFSIKNKRGLEKINKQIEFLGIKYNLKVCDSKSIRKNYDKIILKLRKEYQHKKIRVCFIIRENQKWGYQVLYNLLKKSPYFEPLVLVCPLTSVHNEKDKTRDSLFVNYSFFQKRDINVDYLYKNGKPLNLKKFKPDIVFYDQPWDLFTKHTPYRVGEYSLPMYISYSYETLNDTDNYNRYFHPFLFAYFIEHNSNLERYKRYSITANQNCIVTGYPKLDIYLDEKIVSDLTKFYKEPNKKRIIYAPHHSFDNSLQLATFMENGKFILELAKKHPETTWCFKPHPRFKFALLKMNYMTEKEIDDYFSEWEKIGKVYTQGDYFDLFKSSDLMITDCLSFLGEYLPSKKPLIRLINPNAQSLNELGEKVVSEYYFSHNNKELEFLFNEIVIKGNDYKKENREKLIPEIIDFEKSASQKIYDYLVDLFNGEN